MWSPECLTVRSHVTTYGHSPWLVFRQSSKSSLTYFPEPTEEHLATKAGSSDFTAEIGYRRQLHGFRVTRTWELTTTFTQRGLRAFLIMMT